MTTYHSLECNYALEEGEPQQEGNGDHEDDSIDGGTAPAGTTVTPHQLALFTLREHEFSGG